MTTDTVLRPLVWRPAIAGQNPRQAPRRAPRLQLRTGTLSRSLYLAVAALALVTAASVVQAQQYGAPTRYGEPYAPPSGVGSRRPLDDTPRFKHSPPPPRMAQPGIWQGLYIGGHGGYVTGSATPTNGYDTIDFTGGVFGVHAGYNAQMGSLVLGLEGDGTWSNASGSRAFGGPTFVQTDMNWTSTLRMRAGYAVSNVLFYGTGGLAFGNFDIGVGTTDVASSISKTSLGFVVGGGVEMKFTQNLSGRVEALYYGFNDKTYDFATGSVPVDLNATTVRAGLTYHFN